MASARSIIGSLYLISLFSRHTSRATPCILINIPDGHTKSQTSSGSAAAAADKVRDHHKLTHLVNDNSL